MDISFIIWSNIFHFFIELEVFLATKVKQSSVRKIQSINQSIKQANTHLINQPNKQPTN